MRQAGDSDEGDGASRGSVGLDPGLRHEWDEIVRTVREDMERNLRRQELYVGGLLARYSRCSQALQAQAISISEEEGAAGNCVFDEAAAPQRMSPLSSPPSRPLALAQEYVECAEGTQSMSRSVSPSCRPLTPALKEHVEPFAEHVRQLRDNAKPPAASWAKGSAPLKVGQEADEEGVGEKNRVDSRKRLRRASSLSLSSSLTRNVCETSVAAQVIEAVSKRSPILGHVAERTLPCFETFCNLQEPFRAGRLAAFLRSSRFNLGIGGIILVNAVWTFYLADWTISHPDDPMAEWQLTVEVIFCSIWVLELMLKLIVHRLYFFWNHDMRWNILDTFLVVLTLLDQVATWVDDYTGPGVNLSFLRSLKILRLGRVLRLFRIFRLFRELRNIVNSIFGSLISLFWCMVMLTFMLTLFALAFVILLTDYFAMSSSILEENDLRFHFGSVGRAMTSLYMATTGGQDWHVFYHLLESTGWHNQALFLMFIAFFNLAVFNVLTGIFVDQAMKVTKMDEGKLIVEQRRKVKSETNALKRLCQEMDGDSSGTITWEKFEQHIADPSVQAHFAAVGVEIHDAEAFFRILRKATGSSEVDIDVFLNGCVRMKGYATSIDMQTLAYELRSIRREQAKQSAKLWSMASGEDVESLAPSSTSSVSPRSCSPTRSRSPRRSRSPPRTPLSLGGAPRPRKSLGDESSHHDPLCFSFGGEDTSGHHAPSPLIFRRGVDIYV